MNYTFNAQYYNKSHLWYNKQHLTLRFVCLSKPSGDGAILGKFIATNVKLNGLHVTGVRPVLFKKPSLKEKNAIS